MQHRRLQACVELNECGPFCSVALNNSPMHARSWWDPRHAAPWVPPSTSSCPATSSPPCMHACICVFPAGWLHTMRPHQPLGCPLPNHVVQHPRRGLRECAGHAGVWAGSIGAMLPCHAEPAVQVSGLKVPWVQLSPSPADAVFPCRSGTGICPCAAAGAIRGHCSDRRHAGSWACTVVAWRGPAGASGQEPAPAGV